MIDRDHPPRAEIRDLLFGFEVLRRLGFPTEQIFIGFLQVVNVGPAAVVVLRVGDKSWTWTLCQVDLGQAEALQTELAEAVAFWNSDRNDDGKVPWGYMESPFNNCYLAITGAIQAKGIRVPVTDIPITR